MRPTVFVHSSFRTSSTWIWTKFRENPAALAYYEYFHETLASLTAKSVNEQHPRAWRSRHPNSAPYYIEYLNLLKPDGGVEGFDHTMALGTFFPIAGYDGELSSAEAAYINKLMANAELQGRTAVFCCTRSLGRLRALRRAVGGVHIVLQRKLLNQWNSYSGQARTGGTGFFEMILKTVALNQQEPFMAFLGTFIRARAGSCGNILDAKLDDDDLFVVFVGLHVYLYLTAGQDADVLIRTSELADIRYSKTMEFRLCELTGLDITLGGARERVDLPRALLRNPERVRLETEAICARAVSEAGGGAARADHTRTLLDELWQDEDRFRIQTEELMAVFAQEREQITAELALRAEVAKLLEGRLAEMVLAVTKSAAELAQLEAELKEAKSSPLRLVRRLTRRLARPLSLRLRRRPE
jgi:hypothetical protein